MRATLRGLALAGVLAVGGLWGGATSTKADDWYGGRRGGVNIDIGIGRGYGYGYGYGYRPSYGYYGNGGHDYSPHWHNTYTPYGRYSWYGNGGHDFRPHDHEISGYRGYRSYSSSPWGVTESIHSPRPYVYMPW